MAVVFLSTLIIVIHSSSKVDLNHGHNPGKIVHELMTF